MGILSKFRRPEKFTKEQPQSPADGYTRAKKTWDDYVGSAVVQSYNWRRIAICMVVANVVLAGGLVAQSYKSTVIPYIVEVDTQTGEIKNGGPLTQSNHAPQEPEYKYFLSQFVKETRGIPLDPVVYQNNWKHAGSYLTKNAAKRMADVVRSEKIKEKFGTTTVQVEIISVLPVKDSNSYQIRWNEESYGIGSGEKQITPMSGIFTVTLIPPKDEATMAVNPLGLYISDFSFSKDASAATNTGNGNKK